MSKAKKVISKEISRQLGFKLLRDLKDDSLTEEQKFELTVTLLDSRADFTVEDEHGEKAIDVACSNLYYRISQFLLVAYREIGELRSLIMPESREHTFLDSAYKFGDHELVKFTLSMIYNAGWIRDFIDYKPEFTNAIFNFASSYRKSDLVKFILDQASENGTLGTLIVNNYGLKEILNTSREIADMVLEASFAQGVFLDFVKGNGTTIFHELLDIKKEDDRENILDLLVDKTVKFGYSRELINSRDFKGKTLIEFTCEHGSNINVATKLLISDLLSQEFIGGHHEEQSSLSGDVEGEVE